MVAEQDSIILSFIICLLSFSLSCVGYFWVIMTVEAAMISTVVMAIGAYYWIAHGLRIYNKFKFDDPRRGWEGEGTSDDEETEPLLKYVKHTRNARTNQKSLHATDVRTEVITAPRVFREGHLSRLDIVANIEYWNRKYFVLVETSMFYFDTQRDYELCPSKPSSRRPIRLGGYNVEVMRNNTNSGFYLRLVPSSKDDERKVWDFKCDTLDELNDWSHAFSDAVELANIEGAQGGGGSYGRNNNDDDDNGVGDGGVEMPGSGNGGVNGNIRSRGFVNIS